MPRNRAVLSAFIVFVLFSMAAYAAPQPSDYVRASGTSLVVGSDDHRVFFRGVGFGNDVWSNPSIPVATHHSEADFRLIRDSNFNAVRFYLNATLFEDDARPSVYKKSGFDWLDQNIAWAEKYDIYLILSMEIAPGGSGTDLWDKPGTRSRLAALWKAIAEHCRDKTRVGGYDLLNGPQTTSSIAQWQDLAADLVRAVRSVDPFHLVIVQRLAGVRNQGPTYGMTNFFLVKDPNAAYGFTFYDPVEYTNQYAPWMESTKGVEGGVYPDETRVVAPADAVWAGFSDNSPRLATGTTDWKEFNGDFAIRYKVTNSAFVAGRPVFQVMGTGPKGACWFDDFEVREYAPDGKSRTVASGDFTDLAGSFFWSKDGSGTSSLDPAGGHSGAALRVEGTKGDAVVNLMGHQFAVTTGYSYAIRAWYRGSEIPAKASISVRMDFDKSPSGAKALPRNKDYLSARLKPFLDWGKANKVPLYVAEFGLYRPCFEKDARGVDRGGTNWVRDMATLIVENDLSATYHSWHETAFGIYANDFSRLPDPSALTPGILDQFKTAYSPAAQRLAVKSGKGLSITVGRLGPVFPVFYSYYNDNPVGNVFLKNWEKTPAEDISVSFQVKEYMTNPKVVSLPGRIEPGQERQVDLFGLFTNKMLELSQGSLVSANVILQYSMGGKPARQEIFEDVKILDRNALTWDDDRKVAAFVNAKDQAVLKFARNVSATLRDKAGKSLNQNLSLALGIHEALSLYGIAYTTDPSSAYEKTTQSRTNVDFLQFPQQTLEYRTGDCDDLSILYCSLLESIGIETAFITVPGHIYMAFSVDMTPAEARKRFLKPDDLIYRDEKSWVPIEVTQREGGFLKAWAVGAKEWWDNDAHQQARLYPTRDAWQLYPAVGLVGPAAQFTMPADDRIAGAFGAEVKRFVDREISPRETQLKTAMKKNPKDPKPANQLGVLYAQYGQYDKAQSEFKRILASQDYVPTLLNMGNVSVMTGDSRKAQDYYARAYKLAPTNARVLLAWARANHEAENYGTAQEAYGRLKAVDPDLARQFSWLQSRGEESKRADNYAALSGSVLWEGQ